MIAGGPRVLHRHRTVVRSGLVVLALTQVVVGAWALVAPRAFFDGFPAAGHAWVALLPPYNEHLVRDVGGLSLALTVLLGTAATTLDVRLVRVTLAAFLVYTVPHAVFHSAHLHGFTVTDAVAQTGGFVLQVGLAVALLLLTVLTVPTGVRTPTPGDRTA